MSKEAKNLNKRTSPLWRMALRLSVSLMSHLLVGFFFYAGLLVALPEQKVLQVLVLVATPILSLIILYHYSWKFGERDRNMIKYGHIKDMPLKGLWAGLIACGLPAAGVLTLILLRGPLLQDLYFALLLLVPITTRIGYYCGQKLIAVGSRLIYKDAKRQDKRLR